MEGAKETHDDIWALTSRNVSGGPHDQQRRFTEGVHVRVQIKFVALSQKSYVKTNRNTW